MTVRPFLRRWAASVAIIAILSGCVGSSSPGGSGASSPVPAPSLGAPSSSDSPAPSGSADVSPGGSPTSPAAAFEDLPDTEGVLNAIWVGDGQVVVAGFTGPGFSPSILVFDNGRWSVAATPEIPGQVTALAEIGGRLIAVGNSLPDRRSGFIWGSTDGLGWQSIQTIEDAALYDVMADEGVVVAVGALHDAEMNATAAAWTSADGTTWTPATIASSGGATMASVTAAPGGYAATGDRRLGEPRPFWSATAATSWTGVENDLGDQLLPTDLVSWGDQLAMVGASGKSGDQHPFVALSSDGASWQQTNLSTADEGYASAAAVVNNGLVVAGVDADRLTIWTLAAGTWTPETVEPSGASISALTWGPDLGLLAVGARDGRMAVWLLDEA